MRLWTATLLLIFFFLERIASQDVCPFEVLIWTSRDMCEGPPTTRTPLFVDGSCQFSNVTDGPGFYRATCDATQLLFQESGCVDCQEEDSSCALDNSTSGTVAQSYALSDATSYNPPIAKNITIPSAELESFTCHQLRLNNNVLFSFALFGDCSDTSCMTPSASPSATTPTLSPAPSPQSSAVVGQDICPFEALVWGSTMCQGQPSARFLIYTDEECQASTVAGGPGNYRATCDEATSQIKFQSAGCLAGCPSSGDESTCIVDDSDAGRIAQLYFNVDPTHVYSAPLPPGVVDPSTEVASFICHQLSIEGEVLVSYAFFGDCSDRTCTSPTPVPTLAPTGILPTASPNPTGDAPTMSPTMMSTASTRMEVSRLIGFASFVIPTAAGLLSL